VEAFQIGEIMAPMLNEGGKPPITKARRSQLVLSAAMLAAFLSTAAGAGQAIAAGVSPQQLKAKLDYCEVCHGVQAQGFVGYFPMPRLAGQQVEYIENELKGFVSHKRANSASPEKTNVMFNVGHVLSPEMIKALAESFHKLNPKPLGGAPKTNIAAGKKIFIEGIPSAKVPACASCHGEDAKGNGEIPRLAGQLYPYVVTQLTNWAKERAETNSSIMAPIAHNLTQSQIHAVAAYVSYLQ
jgi:cbb3-type cytochrome c oxidase subunit III